MNFLNTNTEFGYLGHNVANGNTDLEIWGTNLSSTVGVKFTRTQLSMVRLPWHIQTIMVGLILSDAWVIFDNKTYKNALLGFSQSGANSQYFWFVFSLLSHYCPSFPLVRIRSRLGTKTIALQFKTRSMPCFTALHSLFYPGGTKVVPTNIYVLLTPVALAHWIMGDGSTERHGLIICTDSYSIEDVVRLINVLIIRYRLECTLRHHTPTQPRIDIRQRSMPLLRTIVRPHMHSSMANKLGELKAHYTTEGCFFINIQKSKTHIIGYVVALHFFITQDSRDVELLKSFIKFFGCGRIKSNSNQSWVNFVVTKSGDLTNKIIPFLHPIEGVKSADFSDFCKAAELIKHKGHLTSSGLKEINTLKSQMNLKREHVLPSLLSDTSDEGGSSPPLFDQL